MRTHLLLLSRQRRNEGSSCQTAAKVGAQQEAAREPLPEAGAAQNRRLQLRGKSPDEKVFDLNYCFRLAGCLCLFVVFNQQLSILGVLFTLRRTSLGLVPTGLTGLPRAEVGAPLLLVLSEPPARRLGGPGTLSSLRVVAAADSHGLTLACTQSRHARM